MEYSGSRLMYIISGAKTPVVMSIKFREGKGLTRRAPLTPLRFPTSGFTSVDDSVRLEEEQFDEFESGQFYPVNIGDVFASTYQVIGKLGFGTTSTVWLARNLVNHYHVALKVYTRDRGDQEEFQNLEIISRADLSHPGYRHVRTALDILKLHWSGDDHCCLVQRPMWESWKETLRRNPSGRFTEPLLKAGLRHLFAALDYLHSECKLVHTDIKADNILQEIKDERILQNFEESEFTNPSTRKFTRNGTIYASRTLDLPQRFGGPVLSDFGAAVPGDMKRNHDAQPAVYRSPEVMLKAEWSHAVDIWNVGVMIWDLFEGRHLFHGNDPDGQGYSTRAHLAEVIGILGPPPIDLLDRGRRSREFFTEDGKWSADVQIPLDSSLEGSEVFLKDKNKEAFLNLIKGMLQWRPEDRKSAKQLAQDPWINS